MAVITLTTDFGLKDHYAASVKGALLRQLPSTAIVDITHLIPAYDFGQAAYVLGRAFNEFPSGSIHIIVVGSGGGGRFNHVAVKLNGHYFIGCDNGVFSLLSNSQSPEMVVELAAAGKEPSTFVARDLYVPAAIKLAKGIALELIGTSQSGVAQRIRHTSPPEDDVLKGIVVYVDSFGNLITDISGDDFDRIGKGRQFTIQLFKETITEIHRSYGDVPAGSLVALFNSEDFLEIAVNSGPAASLLNMRYNSVVRISFI